MRSGAQRFERDQIVFSGDALDEGIGDFARCPEACDVVLVETHIRQGDAPPAGELTLDLSHPCGAFHAGLHCNHEGTIPQL